jgi:hypothetical protein
VLEGLLGIHINLFLNIPWQVSTDFVACLIRRPKRIHERALEQIFQTTSKDLLLLVLEARRLSRADNRELLPFRRGVGVSTSLRSSLDSRFELEKHYET